ncbi:MAG: D-alanine--D-alanine ligase, partial [Candidatus Margulisbacteria bacterium]|nr:D-alanine--D-alanine ligase [Candidatus Margulisiibacteriota bacterium]
GQRVLESLKKQGFDVLSFDLDEGLVQKLQKEKVDLVYIALHGKYGEDGVIQGVLELAGIPYTGSKVLASALAMNKVASKRIFDAVGIPTPRYLEIDATCDLKLEIDKIKQTFPFPLMLKPVAEGSSLGVSLIKAPGELDSKLVETAAKYKDVFVEEYILGKEITVGIIGTGKEMRALPILELVPQKEFYDYEAKYTAGMTKFILPANLPKPIYKKTQDLALDAHRALRCYGVSRVDMIVGRDHIPYVHEVNTIPGMTEHSDLPAEAACAGISFDELVVKILESAY